ncbi:MAG: cobaltochelatase subunit CobN, partial [Sporomusaceae bacterium]|jgi:cobaltochelatase CobN|nr:cobaltochelatase subunit CobN [Sporomusaceae bacterium]
VVRKAKKWALLHHKTNSKKKIAIIFHNYPPNNSNIGSAQGMDSPESIRLLLKVMANEGYVVEHIPPDSQALMNELIQQSTNDRRFLTDEQIASSPGKVSAKEYQDFFHTLAPETQDRLIEDWGNPPGEVFNYDDTLLVPGMLNGNIFITVQPPRGFGEDAGKILHSPDLPTTHHYLAYYHWLRDIWQADAVVHVGTHGSLEWLPGKGSGLSRQCYPDISLGDLPDIYPYLITIVGEGIQAKRRGAACLIGHLPPPMSRADTYDELLELENLLDEYCHFKITQQANVEVVANLIREKAAALNLEDIPEQPEEPFDNYLERLHAYITDIKNMQIRTGLHVMGSCPQEEMLVEYLLALTRLENGEIPSLPQVIAAIYGYDYYELFEKSSQLVPDGSKTYGKLIDEIRERSREVILSLLENGFNLEKINLVKELSWLNAAAQNRQEEIGQIAAYICGTLAPNLKKTEQEISNLIAALEGEYVEPGPAGAPTSGMADILPTGRNFYGVDPRTLPTKAAWELGKTLGDSVIERYIADEGRYPETVGIVMFCGANLRSRGQCLAEFYYLLGVRPVWQRGSQRVVDLEIIPLSELKRPRIDVTARISGMIRDAFPMIIPLLDKAVNLVASLDENPESNFIRKHVLADAAELEQEGIEPETAWTEACYRIFGDPPGAYGAGVAYQLEEKNWETVDDLGKTYIRWGAHAYGKNAKGVFVPELFTRRMGSIDVTVKNEDNREVHMLNADDFNSYHGGMIAAVRSVRGKAPRSYCGDSSDRKNAVVRSLGEEMKRLFRGEVFNPKFINGMKNHGYKGAADLAGIVAHAYEWDATSSVIDDWMYNGLAQKYALDPEMQKWMQEVNPWALARIAEKLLEASARSLWQADENVLQELRDLYLSIEGDLEEGSDWGKKTF